MRVNERFADAILEHSGPDSRVWIHDFHLMLVPAMLRRRAPGLSVGFFLHTPFPSSEIYRLLPAREDVLRGLLGADYVSFQVGDYARHFRSSCLRIIGLDSQPGLDRSRTGARSGIGVDPIGIDVPGFRETLEDPETARLLAQLEEQYAGRKLVLGVERLDYTKGIPHKLLAFERLLEQDPSRAQTTTMLQVLVPSRLESPEYRQQRDEIELLISRINGRFGQPGITPVEYLHRDISKEGLVALYRRADVMMVTPLRDGMNLVAHEFVLCQSEPGLPGRWRGSLLLSELAGSAQVLPGAMLVNPWNVDGVVERLGTALELDLPERRRRLETMAKRVEALDSRKWADGFLTRLGRHSRRDRRRKPPNVEGEVEERLLRRFARARTRTVMLDYDGTLRELELASRPRHPDARDPHAAARAGRASRDRRAHRQRAPSLAASRSGSASSRFISAPSTGTSLERLAASGARSSSSISVGCDRSSASCGESRPTSPAPTSSGRRCSVAWHYREAELEYGSWRAHELLNDLGQHLGGAPAEILQGHRVVEVRARGVDKGVYVRDVFPNGKEASHFVIGIGDDRTDHDLLDALPSGSVAGHVGGLLPSTRTANGPREHIQIVGPGEVRALLREMAESLRAEG